MINNLSINDDFWINYSENRVSLRWKSLPDKTHFTIATHKNSDLINFHITKENGNDKPQLRLIEIKKNELEEICQIFSAELVTKVISEITISDYKIDAEKIEFISIKQFDQIAKNNQFDEILRNSLVRNDNLVKKKLSIKGDITDRVEDLLLNDEVVKVLNETISTLSFVLENEIKGDGFVILPNQSEILLRVLDRWYSLKTNIDIDDTLISLLGEKLYQQIRKTFYEYLDLIKVLETKEDSLRYSKPILITILREKE